ncbi:unnamed protein product [Somion occarium]|uniref:Uncharacterized protein n=1 Tax=Somion occarium TaxID=3059160 RepID=A0ABP1DYQ0_9APHY
MSYKPPSIQEINWLVSGYKITSADEEFIAKSQGSSPFPSGSDSDVGISIFKATMGALVALSALAGPMGIVFAAGAAIIDVTLDTDPTAPSSAPTLSQISKEVGRTIEEKLQDRDIAQRIALVRSVLDYIDQNKEILEALEKDETGTKKIYPRSTHLEDNVDYLKTQIIPQLIKYSSPGGLYDGLTGLGEVATHPPWHRPDIRAAHLLVFTTLFITQQYLSLIYSRLAALERHRGNKSKAQNYTSSYYNQLDVMQGKVEQQLALLNENINRLRKWRRDEITDVAERTPAVVEDSGWTPPGAYGATVPVSNGRPSNVISWKDNCTGNNHERRASEYYYGLFNMLRGWRFDDAWRDSRPEHDAYMDRLNAHIDRVLKPDMLVAQGWQATLEAATKFLKIDH